MNEHAIWFFFGVACTVILGFAWVAYLDNRDSNW